MCSIAAMLESETLAGCHALEHEEHEAFVWTGREFMLRIPPGAGIVAFDLCYLGHAGELRIEAQGAIVDQTALCSGWQRAALLAPVGVELATLVVSPTCRPEGDSRELGVRLRGIGFFDSAADYTASRQSREPSTRTPEALQTFGSRPLATFVDRGELIACYPLETEGDEARVWTGAASNYSSNRKRSSSSSIFVMRAPRARSRSNLAARCAMCPCCGRAGSRSRREFRPAPGGSGSLSIPHVKSKAIHASSECDSGG